MKTIDVVAAILEREGLILLAQRPDSGDQPGLWEFPGGKVEPGESEPEALRRELQEELNIDVEPQRYLASHEQAIGERIIRLHAWYVPAFTGELRALHHTALVWCSPQAAFNYSLAPVDVPLLATFIDLRDAISADGY